tara:strand:- start:461 stop:3817 length:3357 start_codon:yes stop_codon:yes gene_type:complete
MAEESIPQFRSPLPNIGVGYSGGGGGGGMPQTTVAMQQLKKYVSDIGGSIVANRKLNIEKEIADAEMNVALGMVKPPTESMQENRLVMDKYNAVRARNFGIEDAGLLLDQADTMVAESMEGFVFGSEDQESPAKKLVDKLEEFNAGTALREDRQEPTLLLNKNYTEQILMARQKVEGALRQEVQKESIRQRTVVAKSAIKNKLQELNTLLQTPQSPTFEVTKSISPNDFKRIYKELAPQFPLLGPQVEVLVYDQVISDSIETIQNPAASDAEAVMAYKMATALDQPGYARNNMSLAEIVQGRSKLTGPSSGVTKARTALVKRNDDAQKKRRDQLATHLRTLSNSDLAKLSRGNLALIINDAGIESGEAGTIMKRYDDVAETNSNKTDFESAWKVTNKLTDIDILNIDPGEMAARIAKRFDLEAGQQSDLESILRGRKERLKEAQETLLEETHKKTYINTSIFTSEADIRNLFAEDLINEAQRDGLIAKNNAFQAELQNIEDEEIKTMFQNDMERMDLPISPKQAGEFESLLQKYSGYKDLQTRLKERKNELKEYFKFETELAKEKTKAQEEYERLLENPEELKTTQNIAKNPIFLRTPELAEKLINAKNALNKPSAGLSKIQKENKRQAELSFASHLAFKNQKSIIEKEVNEANYPDLFKDGADPSLVTRLQEHKNGLIESGNQRKRDSASKLSSFLLREGNAKYLASVDLTEYKDKFEFSTDLYDLLVIQQKVIGEKLKDPRFAQLLYYEQDDNILKFNSKKLTKKDKALDPEDLIKLEGDKNRKIEENRTEERKYNFGLWYDDPDLINKSNVNIKSLTGDKTELTGKLIAKRDELIFNQNASKEEKGFVSKVEDYLFDKTRFKGMTPAQAKAALEWKGDEPLTAHANSRRNAAITAYRDFVELTNKSGSSQEENTANIYVSQTLREVDFDASKLFTHIDELAAKPEGEGISNTTYRNLRDDIQEAIKARQTDFGLWESSTAEMFNEYIRIPRPDSPIWQTILDSPTSLRLRRTRADLRREFRTFLQGVYDTNKDQDWGRREIQEASKTELERLEQKLTKLIPDMEQTVLQRLKNINTENPDGNATPNKVLELMGSIKASDNASQSDNASETQEEPE